MKKIIGSLIALTIFGISSLFACPHTNDGSTCPLCMIREDDEQHWNKVDAAFDRIGKYGECVKDNAVAGAAAGAVVGGSLGGLTGAAVGISTGTVGGAIFGVVDCADGDSYIK